MRKLLSMFVSVSAVLALTACGGGSDGDYNGGGGNGGGPSGPEIYSIVDVLDLDRGYIIDGHNNIGERVTFEYCHGRYKYINGDNYAFYGDFSIKNSTRINMYDDDGGSYRIDTNGYLEVGVAYPIIEQYEYINVDEIIDNLGC